MFPHDDTIIAIATDQPIGADHNAERKNDLNNLSNIVQLDINDPPAIADFIIQSVIQRR
jgi:hypothetical protein